MLSRKSNRPTRVLIVDDHPAYAETLEMLLASDDRIRVVGRAYDGVEGVEKALELRPDVVVMDIQMPRMDGLDATRHITAKLRSTGVVVVTSSSAVQATQAIAAGATAFLHKDAPLRDLADAIVDARRPASTEFRVRMLEARAV